MSSSNKYYDTSAAIQVIGGVLNNPELVLDSRYDCQEYDFVSDFHRVVYGAILNLKGNGAGKINTKVLEDYFETHEHSGAIYKAHNGANWVYQAYQNADILNFEYYYNRLKKMSLLRSYDEIGVDVSWIYDPDNITDFEKKERQEKYLDDSSLKTIAEEIENRVLRVREIVVDGDQDESCALGDGIENMLQDLQEKPLQGVPLWDKYLNRIALGGRQGCFYLRSAATGVGKSRTAMADACYLASKEYWDVDKQEWVSTGAVCNVTFISVELDKEELQTMALAFIAGIPEGHILRGEMTFEEQERAVKGVQILQEMPLYIEYFPDYSLTDIENCIKRNIRTHQANIVFLDYITTSMKIIEEVSRASGGMKIREDQVLFLLSSKLKDIATKSQAFIFSSTQINGEFRHSKILDQTMLAGAKAIANRIDFGSIMVDVTEEDLEDIAAYTDTLGQPNIKMSIYKNRRGEFNRIILWMRADKGTCRYKTLFVTDFDFNLVTGVLKSGKEGSEE